MSIFSYVTSFYERNKEDLVLGVAVSVISLISFGAGLLASENRIPPEPITIISAGSAGKEQTPEESVSSGIFLASISGTKYYLPECSGAARIKEENRIWFDTREDAEKAGYEPAANCPGMVSEE